MRKGEFESVRGTTSTKRLKQRHHEGWDAALDKAITKFEQQNADAKGEFTADLKLSIKFYKESPGWVGEYSIDLERIHQTGH